MKLLNNLETSFWKKITQIIILITCYVFVSCTKTNTDSETFVPVVFSPKIPHDVDPVLQKKLKEEGNIYDLNKAFNEYSWQAFVAINWPVDKNGKPLPNFTDKGTANWMKWKEAQEVYRNDGMKPAPWEGLRVNNQLVLGMATAPKEALQSKNIRLLSSIGTPTGHVNIVGEEDQAFSGPLYDQNGNIVRYEVLMNREEFDYVVNNKLYNINGQIEFSSKSGFTAVDFPSGEYGGAKEGAIEIKLAWKILENTDHKERYFRSEGFVINNETGKWEKKELGMIGFHISQKTKTGKQWVWSTFEHVDNLRTHEMEKDGKTVRVKPSLTNPDCELCPVNTRIDTIINGKASTKYVNGTNGPFWSVGNSKSYAKSSTPATQAKRMIPINDRVLSVNGKMQAYFKSMNSVWQYYELIDTQYPLNQNTPPASTSQNKLPQVVANKSGGDANIAFLTNLSMETFFQLGNQPATNLIENNPTNNISIFGTESCMGCHSSAGIFTKGKLTDGLPPTKPQLSADFSWLLQSKAHWEKNLEKNN